MGTITVTKVQNGVKEIVSITELNKDQMRRLEKFFKNLQERKKKRHKELNKKIQHYKENWNPD